MDIEEIRSQNDAVVLSTGATWPRDLKIPNREADGIHFAMEFLQVRLDSNSQIFRLLTLICSSSTRPPCWTPSCQTTIISMQRARTSSLLEVVTLATIVSAQQCVMVPSLLLTLSCCHARLHLGGETTHGPNTLGTSQCWCFSYVPLLNHLYRSIFRTDYGHTEVAAHFGQGTYKSHMSVASTAYP